MTYGISVDTTRDSIFSDHALSLLKDFYMVKGENSPQEAFARACSAWSAGDVGLAQRLYDAVSKGWFMLASPVLSNAPKPGEKGKGMPISCFLSYVPDSIEGLIAHSAEERWLSVSGGGVGGHWSSVRTVSDKAPGPIPFLHTVDADMAAFNQGKTRKGAYAAYLDISHPDIEEFIEIRKPTGDLGRKCTNLHHAVNITDEFMEAVLGDKQWNLIDPHTKKATTTVRARELWEKILETRYLTGEPYLNFIDTVNMYLNPYQKQAGLRVKGSNLCNEIHLVTDENRTAVCCLSSLNLEKYDEWKDTTIVADLVTMLDNVLQYFIDNAPPYLAKAVHSAKMERSIGLGVMGFHSYLQQHNIPFESNEARALNTEVFTSIYYAAKEISKQLAISRGVPEDLRGSTDRFAHIIAIAPNANSGIIAGCSPSIEPLASNSYVHRTRAGSHLVTNRYLASVLAKYGKDNRDTWRSIVAQDGSVQHLDFLSAHEKLVFKTAYEINMEWVVQHAADRQPFICQGQSVNFLLPAKTERGYFNKIHVDAWRKGLKGLYYVRTKAEQKAEIISTKIERVPLSNTVECVACQA